MNPPCRRKRIEAAGRQTGKTPGGKRQNADARDLPAFCDFSCPHASFADAASVGACRRELGVYCTLFGAYNNKNSACIAGK